jgi:hypothetical protein
VGWRGKEPRIEEPWRRKRRAGAERPGGSRIERGERLGRSGKRDRWGEGIDVREELRASVIYRLVYVVHVEFERCEVRTGLVVNYILPLV